VDQLRREGPTAWRLNCQTDQLLSRRRWTIRSAVNPLPVRKVLQENALITPTRNLRCHIAADCLELCCIEPEVCQASHIKEHLLANVY